jgi:hypothetical protein
VSSASTPGYQELVDLLSANATSKHQVLNDGVKLGKQLVEAIYNEDVAWKLLADFWSEMILYCSAVGQLERAQGVHRPWWRAHHAPLGVAWPCRDHQQEHRW